MKFRIEGKKKDMLYVIHFNPSNRLRIKIEILHIILQKKTL
jgi:hypothetical protein